MDGVWTGSCLFNVRVWCLSARCVQAGHIKRSFRLVRAVTVCEPSQLRKKTHCFNPQLCAIQYYRTEVAVERGCIWGTSTLMWATRDKPAEGNGLSDMNLSGALLLAIMNILFKHTVVKKCFWYQLILVQRSVINYVVVFFSCH